MQRYYYLGAFATWREILIYAVVNFEGLLAFLGIAQRRHAVAALEVRHRVTRQVLQLFFYFFLVQRNNPHFGGHTDCSDPELGAILRFRTGQHTGLFTFRSQLDPGTTLQQNGYYA